MINPIIPFPKVSYWAWIATIYLIFLTFKDFKNRGFIDDRHNWVLMGVSISLLAYFPRRLFAIVGMIITLIVFRIYLQKFKVIGEADINALSWVFFGFGVINYSYLLWFGLFFIIMLLVYTGLKKLFKITANTPFFIVILLTFWFNCFIFKIY